MHRAIPPNLPIVAALPELWAVLSDSLNAVLVAPPGAGKTTSVPLALLDAPWLGSQKIIMLAPRRLAARTAAARMASLLCESIGQTVGYRVRLDSKIGPNTRIEVVTEGVFTRMLLDDPELKGIGLVIFDEVHERNLEGDLALALALDAQSGLREDLRLLAMSATLDGARVGALMKGAPIVESQGRIFPVETIYAGHKPNTPFEIQAADVALRALGEGEGDVLVFLPGIGEIKRAQTHLNTKNQSHVSVVVLHGSLDPVEQDRALAPTLEGQRKIILATAIAETSLTINGVRIVVDCGFSRRAAYEPDTGLTALITVRSSRASSDQRRGRAGRTAPGRCYRLWEEAQTGAFPAFDRPEILEADLAPLALTLAAWGVTDPSCLRWLDCPPIPAWREACALLNDLGALALDGRVTPHGRKLSGFGLPPRLAHMIIAAGVRGFGTVAACVAAILSERGLGGTSVDLTERLNGLKRDSTPRAIKARAQAQSWARQVDAHEPMDPEQAGKALALAFPERVAKARDRQGGFVLRNGRAGEVAREERLSGATFLAVGALQGRAANARITEAANLSRADLDDLFGDQITNAVVSSFDKATRTMRGRSQTRLGALILDETTVRLEPEETAKGLMKAIEAYGLSILNWTTRAVLLRSRLAWLHAHNPDDWLGMDDDELMARRSLWLEPALQGIASLNEIDVATALMSQLDWPSTQRLAIQAPERFETPAGTSHAINYASQQGPTVDVRVQEVFGIATHPMLAGGHAALVFQLLSPAHKPVAITANLPAFWKGAWHDVRKDMKARYPRHVWPDDPACALPTTRAKPRGT